LLAVAAVVVEVAPPFELVVLAEAVAEVVPLLKHYSR